MSNPDWPHEWFPTRAEAEAEFERLARRVGWQMSEENAAYCAFIYAVKWTAAIQTAKKSGPEVQT